jgi:hypothetical protein
LFTQFSLIFIPKLWKFRPISNTLYFSFNQKLNMAATATPGHFSQICNAMAVAYEKSMTPTSRQVIAKVIAEISPPITADFYILDNVCGSEVVTKEIKSLHPDAYIFAADNAPAMVGCIRELVTQKPWCEVEVEN